VAIEDKIPQMTDGELQNLHDNAARISAGATSKQQAEALRLLPIIVAAMAERSALRATEAAEKRAAKQKSLAEAREKKNAERKAAKQTARAD
jgi:hypothetical protein